MITDDSILSLATNDRPLSPTDAQRLHHEMCRVSHEIRHSVNSLKRRHLANLRLMHSPLARLMPGDADVRAVGRLLDEHNVAPAPTPWSVVEADKEAEKKKLPTAKRKALEQRLAEFVIQANDETLRRNLAPAIEIMKERLRPEVEARRAVLRATAIQQEGAKGARETAAELGNSVSDVDAMLNRDRGPIGVDNMNATAQPTARDIFRTPRSALTWVGLLAAAELDDPALERTPALAQVLATGLPKNGGE